MNTSGPDRVQQEIDSLRAELDAETGRCLDLQRQLDRSVSDFEEFVSIAAHNMREPLRDVTSFSQLIAATYAGSLDADADACLARIQQGAARLDCVLTDVVDYWAAAAGEPQCSPTDMEAVLQRAILSADTLITARNAIVTHDPLPAAMGNFAILTKVVGQLIGNAIQYCAEPVPRVHVSSKRSDLDWAFSVADNGPGIEPAFHSRVFGAFKRLHGRDFPGNGLGLAYCTKAIGRLGGRIWVESTPGAGATFFFTLPPAG
jgi:light-regulated signal transduction histidine kinase (bacteriophytochrome)